MIDQRHFDFAAIVAVDGARRIENRDAMFDGKAGARPDLGLKAIAADAMANPGRHQTRVRRVSSTQSSAARRSMPAAPAVS